MPKTLITFSFFLILSVFDAAEYNSGSHSPIQLRGPVEGFIDCGSAGRINEVRVTNCTQVPCEQLPGNAYLVEIEFYPSTSHSAIDLKGSVVYQGVTYPIFDIPVEGRIEGGSLYVMSHNLTSSFPGRKDFKYELYSESITEFCVEIGFIAD